MPILTLSPEELLKIIILGLIEGATEFLPISSTGHLIMAEHFLGFTDEGAFTVGIQSGAILAVFFAYWDRLKPVITGLFRLETEAVFFAKAVLIAFLPSAVLGLLFHSQIKALLLNPQAVCWAFILGGIAILVVEKMNKDPQLHDLMEFSATTSFKIGLIQCLSLFPGVSRSGATIVGAMLMGVDRKAATEFSFFLAIPTIFGATVLDIYKSWDSVSDYSGGGLSLAIGFFVSFLSALFVVKKLVEFISHYGFAPFAWWRIIIGGVCLGFLGLGY